MDMAPFVEILYIKNYSIHFNQIQYITLSWHPNITAKQWALANLRVNVIWLVLVKIYGNNPIKLLNKISENRETKIKVDPECPDGP